MPPEIASHALFLEGWNLLANLPGDMPPVEKAHDPPLSHCIDPLILIRTR